VEKNPPYSWEEEKGVVVVVVVVVEGGREGGIEGGKGKEWYVVELCQQHG